MAVREFKRRTAIGESEGYSLGFCMWARHCGRRNGSAWGYGIMGLQAFLVGAGGGDLLCMACAIVGMKEEGEVGD